ncbi:MAG TPA: enoyl-CoA hydratase/isomerase family protein [Polyangia bacterium]|nr:enoyl-CoA hydratase/isomerase family protein [Polyangia bacterium]
MSDVSMISVREHGRVRELSLSRSPVNALDPGLMQALRSALREARQAGCRAVVISGRPGCFSAGLDVPALLRLDRAGIRQAWEGLFSLLGEIAMSDIPIAAALTGHSPAGGAVLAICADYRVLAEGPYLIGLNEVQVGLPVPEVLHRVLTHVVGARTAERLAVSGALIGPAEALRCGLVDELAPLAEVVPRAVAWLEGVLGQAPAAVADNRRRARQPLFDAFATVDGALVEKMLEAWFSPETQAATRALVARLAQEARREAPVQ